MTSFRLERLLFAHDAVNDWRELDTRYSNWPVVYTLNNNSLLYIGETLDAVGRFRQHLVTKSGLGLETVRVVIDETFNKSACLDLESYLIRLAAGDGRFRVLNGNAGITDRSYFDREKYQKAFRGIFKELRREGLFEHTIRQIENSDLFKLSPYKSLTEDQAVVVRDILDGMFTDLEEEKRRSVVVQGDPGTGKTIVGIFMMKLIVDIQASDFGEDFYEESVFSDFFLPDYKRLLTGLRIGLVVPQQSLRDTVRKVFARTEGLDASMVLTPFQVGESDVPFDLLIVDETHRLNQRANQSSGMKNRQFAAINRTLYGEDDLTKTQLDWILDRSRHQIFLIDSAQSVRPADLPAGTTAALVQIAREDDRLYSLRSQMRVRAGSDYVGYIRSILRGSLAEPQSFGDYEFRMFDDLKQMTQTIQERDKEHDLARLVAGYAWPWVSKRNRSAYDIEIDGCKLRWNRADKDWINSKGSLNEVGSIHTVQGYDLNYAGVIIGPDLRFDVESGRAYFDRSSYFDTKGMENNRRLGITYSDEDLLEYVINIYAVLLTRGMLGTFVYVVDDGLRQHLSKFIAT